MRSFSDSYRKAVSATFCLCLIFPILAFPQDSTYVPKGKTREYKKEMIMDAYPGEVFVFMDNIENAGMHMTDNNAAMMGGKLKIEWLTDKRTGKGAKYRWRGKAMGMKMDFTVEVSDWTENAEKTWGTVGKAKMIVISWFEMHLELDSLPGGKTRAMLSIKYKKSRNFPGFFLGRRYSKWCVKRMLKDTREHFRKPQGPPL